MSQCLILCLKTTMAESNRLAANLVIFLENHSQPCTLKVLKCISRRSCPRRLVSELLSASMLS